jgi:YD repeat-containing protein
MKTYAVVAIVMAVLAMEPAVQAQTCWTPVKSWHGNYTLTASGTVSCSGGGATCTADQLAVGEVSATSGACSSGVLEWAFTDMVTTATLNDTMVIPCDPGSQTFTLTGSGGGFSPGDILSFDLGGRTYTYEPYPIVNLWTLTSQDCFGGVTTQNGVDYALYPINGYPPPAPVTLPASVQALTQSSLPFQSDDAQGAIVPWTLSFTLTPNSDCKACRQNEGQRMPVSSSISTQTQSLGEDAAIVGTGLHLHYESGRAPGAAADAIAASDASMIGGWTLSVQHAYDASSNTLFLGDGTQRNGDELGTPVSFNGNTLLTSEDATEVYVFSSAGQHLQTLRPLTGAIEYNFAYDSAAKLISVTDATGNVTTIQRNASEQPTAIVSPYGQTTTLALDSNGFLSQVTDPLGKSQIFVNSSTGLLTSRTDSNGNVFNYTYDSNGKLIKDADPLGGLRRIGSHRCDVRLRLDRRRGYIDGPYQQL